MHTHNAAAHNTVRWPCGEQSQRAVVDTTSVHLAQLPPEEPLEFVYHDSSANILKYSLALWNSETLK